MSKETELKRGRFVEQLFEDICNVPEYSSYYVHIYSKIAALGLQGKAKEENLFGNGIGLLHNIIYIPNLSK